MKSEMLWGEWYTQKVRIFSHLLFWVAVSLLYYLAYNRLVGEYFWIFMIKDLLVTITLFYTASWILPKWIIKGNIVGPLTFIFFAFIWWVTCAYINSLIAASFIPLSEKDIHNYLDIFTSEGYLGIYSFNNLSDLILDFLFLISLPLAPKLTKVIFQGANKLIVLERDKTRLERDILQMELDILKSQISPHFVFNTLNSIYGMASKQDPQTPESILNMSNLLRYVLYQTKDDLIYICHEIQFIKDYLSLMKLRYKETVLIEISERNTQEPYQIVPLILIPFVENAIKHGPESSRKEAWVKVDLEIDDGILMFRIANSLNQHAEKHKHGGLGLQNVKRRLEIYYPEKHTFDISETTDSYTVFLKLNFKSQ
ncbi:sensor histidine kinase [Sphingobacterium sp. HJSM2_6]|uniref:sensor histidine kinase n=1 Tax=Sphingobacterium sp. HJSM2_6 TaxID=3366264 RepID=UPI003BC21159